MHFALTGFVSGIWRNTDVFLPTTFTDQFSGHNTALGLVCVCVCVCFRAIVVELDDLRPRYLALWFFLTVSRSWSKMKVIELKIVPSSLGRDVF